MEAKIGQKTMRKSSKFQNPLFIDFAPKRPPKRVGKIVAKSYEKAVEFWMLSGGDFGGSGGRLLKDVPSENIVFQNRPESIFSFFGRKMASKRASEIDEKMHDFLSCLGDVIFRIFGNFRLPKNVKKVDQNP